MKLKDKVFWMHLFIFLLVLWKFPILPLFLMHWRHYPWKHVPQCHPPTAGCSHCLHHWLPDALTVYTAGSHSAPCEFMWSMERRPGDRHEHQRHILLACITRRLETGMELLPARGSIYRLRIPHNERYCVSDRPDLSTHINIGRSTQIFAATSLFIFQCVHIDTFVHLENITLLSVP